jgi:hypothetical protein
VFGEVNTNGGSVFERAKLLEALGLFERGGRERNEALQEIDAVSVDAEVTIGRKVWDRVAAEGDGGAGEVKGVAESVEDELDDVGVGDERGVIERAAGRDHREGGIVAEFTGEGIDEFGIEERFVALNINDVSWRMALRGGFGNSIGAGGMIGAGANGAGPDGLAEGGDAVVVSGDNELVEFLATRSALEDVLKKRLSKKRMEGFSGEAGRGPAGRDDTNDSWFFVVNNNPP